MGRRGFCKVLGVTLDTEVSVLVESTTSGVEDECRCRRVEEWEMEKVFFPENHTGVNLPRV